MKVTITADVQHLCPYRDEVDQGIAAITLDVPSGDAPELHDMRSRLDGWAVRKISHEAMTREIAAYFRAIRVVTTWRTAGMEVVCDVPGEPLQ